MTFSATEFSITSSAIKPTGKTIYLTADSQQEATKALLYTLSLKGKAYIGPSGRVVHSGKLSYSITEDKQESPLKVTEINKT